MTSSTTGIPKNEPGKKKESGTSTKGRQSADAELSDAELKKISGGNTKPVEWIKS